MHRIFSFKKPKEFPFEWNLGQLSFFTNSFRARWSNCVHKTIELRTVILWKASLERAMKQATKSFTAYIKVSQGKPSLVIVLVMC